MKAKRLARVKGDTPKGGYRPWIPQADTPRQGWLSLRHGGRTRTGGIAHEG
jgi:hypothetical protein